MSGPSRFSRPTVDCCDEAAAWHSRWRASPESSLPSSEELDRWTEWIGNADNRRAYDAVVLSWQLRHKLARPQTPSAQELAADASADADGDTVTTPRLLRLPRLHALLHRQRRVLFAAAAAVVLAGFIGLNLNLHSRISTRAPSIRVISTTEREKKIVKLEDGSRVWLGDKTEISVQFGPCLRTIFLRSGEALFKVAHNPSCPFIVLAGSGAITAVGTQFSVRRTFDRVTVRVAEGVVKVEPRDVASSGPWSDDVPPSKAKWTQAKLAIGDEVTYGSNQNRSPVESADPRVATAWLSGRREYRNEPLSYVVADISRYFGKHIEVTDSSIGDLQFTGRVYESQVDEWLQALETIFPVEVRQTSDDHVVIERRSGP